MTAWWHLFLFFFGNEVLESFKLNSSKTSGGSYFYRHLSWWAMFSFTLWLWLMKIIKCIIELCAWKNRAKLISELFCLHQDICILDSFSCCITEFWEGWKPGLFSQSYRSADCFVFTVGTNGCYLVSSLLWHGFVLCLSLTECCV